MIRRALARLHGVIDARSVLLFPLLRRRLRDLSWPLFQQALASIGLLLLRIKERVLLRMGPQRFGPILSVAS